MRNLPALILLVTAFALIWVPWGQSEFLTAHWMKVGTFMAPFLAYIALSFRETAQGPWLGDVKAMALILWIAYIAHQFEEHWLDLYGRVYAFQAYLNDLLGGLVGADAGAVLVTPADILLINTGPVWLMGALAVWRAPNHVFPSLCMASIALVNAVAHIGGAVRSFEYNPGLLTSIVLFLPLTLAFYRHLLAHGEARRQEVIAAILWSIGAHVFLFAGLVATNHAGIMPSGLYYAGLVTLTVLPTMMFRRG